MKFDGNPSALEARAMAERLGIRVALVYPVVGTPYPALYLDFAEFEPIDQSLEVHQTKVGSCLVFKGWEAACAWLHSELERRRS